MLMKRLASVLLFLFLSVGGLFCIVYSRAWDSFWRFCLNGTVFNAFGAQIESGHLEGGILDGMRLRKLRLNCADSTLLSSFEAESVDADIRVQDLFSKKKITNPPVFLDSVFLNFKRILEIKFSKPMPYLIHPLEFQANPFFRIRVSEQGITFDQFKDSFIFIHRIFLQPLLNDQGMIGLKILTSTPHQDSKNRILYEQLYERCRLIIRDYSLRECLGLFSFCSFIDGRLNCEINWDKSKLKKFYIKIDDLEIQLFQGKEILIQLEALYENDRLNIRQGLWSGQERILKIHGSIKNVLTNPVFNVRARLVKKDGVFSAKVQGPLQQLKWTGDFKADSSVGSHTKLSWSLNAGGVALTDQGLMLKHLTGWVFFHDSIYPSREGDKKIFSDNLALNQKESRLQNIAVKKNWMIPFETDCIINGNRLIFKNAILSDQFHLGGSFNFFKEPFCDLTIALNDFELPASVAGFPIRLSKFAGNVKGSILNPLFSGKGFLMLDRQKIVFTAQIDKNGWILKINSLAKSFFYKGQIHASMTWNRLTKSVICGDLRLGKQIHVSGEVRSEKAFDPCFWIARIYKNKDNVPIHGLWKFISTVNNFKIGPLKSNTIMTLTGDYSFSSKSSFLRGSIHMNDLKVNKIDYLDADGVFHFNLPSCIFILDSLKFGQGCFLGGVCDISKRTMDIALEFKGEDLYRMGLFFPKWNKTEVEGKLNGYVRLLGDYCYPKWAGRLQLDKGRFHDLTFDEARFGLSGYGTIIDLIDSG